MAQEREGWNIGTLADQGAFPKLAIDKPPTDVTPSGISRSSLLTKMGE